MPSLATMPPVHDYPQGMAETNCRDLNSVDNNKWTEYHESVPPGYLHSEEENWTAVASLFLVGLAIVALSIALSLLHFLYFDYTMRRQGVECGDDIVRTYPFEVLRTASLPS